MNLDFELKNKENFKNVKIGIIFIPFSSEINSFRMNYTINKKYNLVDYGEYFVPYYYGIGPFGGEVLMRETYFQRYKEHENRIKKEFLNKFIRTTDKNHTCFYGYFENMSKANRVYNQVLKPYILDKFLPYERVNDQNLIDSIKSLRFK